MDQVTQQNAALVEQMAAAASSLKTQAGELVQVVAEFKLQHDGRAVAPTVATAPRHVPHALGKPAPQRRLTHGAATAATAPAVPKPKSLPSRTPAFTAPPPKKLSLAA